MIRANANRLRRPDSMDLFNIPLFQRLTERIREIHAENERVDALACAEAEKIAKR